MKSRALHGWPPRAGLDIVRGGEAVGDWRSPCLIGVERELSRKDGWWDRAKGGRLPVPWALRPDHLDCATRELGGLVDEAQREIRALERVTPAGTYAELLRQRELENWQQKECGAAAARDAIRVLQHGGVARRLSCEKAWKVST